MTVRKIDVPKTLARVEEQLRSDPSIPLPLPSMIELLNNSGAESSWPGNQACGILIEASRGQGIPCLKGDMVGPAVPSKNEKTMPKLKTHTGAAKRFSKTGTGKIKRGQTKTRHILSSKSPKLKRKLGKTVLVSDGDYAKVARMIPYA